MFNRAFATVLYEIATRTLPRVQLKEKPGVVGIVIQRDRVAATTQVHWGVSDREVFRRWHKDDELEGVENHWKQANPNLGKIIKEELSQNGQDNSAEV